MSTEQIQVSIRSRPLNERERNSTKSKDKAWIIDPNQNYIRQNIPGKKNMTFDRVFPEEADNVMVYEDSSKHIVQSSLLGVNGTIFAYGQTSSGKTYSMQAIMKYGFADIFQHIKADTDRKYELSVSYLEIYNENISDLIDTTKVNLKVVERNGVPKVIGISEHIVKTEHQIIQLVERGQSTRHVGSTNMNEQSSRSHTILTLNIKSVPILPIHTSSPETNTDQNHNTNTTTSSTSSTSPTSPTSPTTDNPPKYVRGNLSASINFVDLAGSERAVSTGAQGQRLKEGAHINQSLSILGNVIRRICERKPGEHIPYRDSKLTRILQSALGGNSRTAVICCVTQSSGFVEETIGTLGFAWRCKLVRNCVGVNETVDETTRIVKLQQELDYVRLELRRKQKLLIDFDIVDSSTGEIIKSRKYTDGTTKRMRLDMFQTSDGSDGSDGDNYDYNNQDNKINSNTNDKNKNNTPGNLLGDSPQNYSHSTLELTPSKLKRRSNSRRKSLITMLQENTTENPTSQDEIKKNIQEALEELALQKKQNKELELILLESGMDIPTTLRSSISIEPSITQDKNRTYHTQGSQASLSDILLSSTYVPLDANIIFASPSTALYTQDMTQNTITSLNTTNKLMDDAGDMESNNGLVTSVAFSPTNLDIENDSAFFDRPFDQMEDETMMQDSEKVRTKKVGNDIDSTQGLSTSGTLDNDEAKTATKKYNSEQEDNDPYADESMVLFSELAASHRNYMEEREEKRQKKEKNRKEKNDTLSNITMSEDSDEDSTTDDLTEDLLQSLLIRVKETTRLQLQSDVYVAAKLVLHLSTGLHDVLSSQMSQQASTIQDQQLRQECEEEIIKYKEKMIQKDNLLEQIQTNLSTFSHDVCTDRDQLQAQILELQKEVTSIDSMNSHLREKYKILDNDSKKSYDTAMNKYMDTVQQLQKSQEEFRLEKTLRIQAEQRVEQESETVTGLQTQLRRISNEVESLHTMRDASERAKAIASEECLRLSVLVREYENELDEIRNVLNGTLSTSMDLNNTTEGNQEQSQNIDNADTTKNKGYPNRQSTSSHELANRAAKLAILEESTTSLRAILTPYIDIVRRKQYNWDAEAGTKQNRTISPEKDKADMNDNNSDNNNDNDNVRHPMAIMSGTSIDEEDIANITIDFSYENAASMTNATDTSHVSRNDSESEADHDIDMIFNSSLTNLPLEEFARRLSYSIEMLHAKYRDCKSKIQLYQSKNTEIQDLLRETEETLHKELDKSKNFENDSNTLRSIRLSLEREGENLRQQNQQLHEEIEQLQDTVQESKDTIKSLEDTITAQLEEKVLLEKQLETLASDLQTQTMKRREERRLLLSRAHEHEEKYNEVIRTLHEKLRQKETDVSSLQRKLVLEKQLYETLKDEVSDHGEQMKEEAVQNAEKLHEEALLQTRTMYQSSLEQAHTARALAQEERHNVEIELCEVQAQHQNEKQHWVQALNENIHQKELLERKLEAEILLREQKEEELRTLRKESAAAAHRREENALLAEKDNIFLREELAVTKRQLITDRENFETRVFEIQSKTQSEGRLRASLEQEIDTLKGQCVQLSRQTETMSYEKQLLLKKNEKERVATQQQIQTLRDTVKKIQNANNKSLMIALKEQEEKHSKKIEALQSMLDSNTDRKDSLYEVREKNMKRKLDDAEDHLAQVTSKQKADIQRLQLLHQSELTSLKNEHELSQILMSGNHQKIIEDYHSKIHGLEDDYEKLFEQLQALNATLAAKSTEANLKIQQAHEFTKQSSEDTEVMLEVQKNAIKTECAREYEESTKELNEKNLKLKKQIVKFMNADKSNVDKFRKLQDDLATSNNKVSSLEKKIEVLQQDLQLSNKKLSKFREKNTSAIDSQLAQSALLRAELSTNTFVPGKNDTTSMSDMNSSFSHDFASYLRKPLIQSTTQPRSLLKTSATMNSLPTTNNEIIPTIVSSVKTPTATTATTTTATTSMSDSKSKNETTYVDPDDLDNTINFERLLNIDEFKQGASAYPKTNSFRK